MKTLRPTAIRSLALRSMSVLVLSFGALSCASAQDTANLGKRDGTFSKAYFREYEIPGNQPMTLQMAYQSAAGAPGSTYCRAFGGTFTPEAGKQYEVSLEFAPDRCLPVVREIQESAQGPAILRDIAVAPAKDCD